MAPRIVLYAPRGMSLTEKVGRALRLKRLVFEICEPKTPEDYRRFSPDTGLLPALDCEGALVADSAAILDFLDERFPEPPLVSADLRAAREQRRLERWIDEWLPFYVLRWVRGRIGSDVPLPVAGSGFPHASMSQLGLIGGGRLHTEAFDPAGEGLGPEFARRLADLEQMLGTRRYFYADRISRADLSVCAALSMMYRDVYPGAKALLAERATLYDHVERVLDETGGPKPV